MFTSVQCIQTPLSIYWQAEMLFSLHWILYICFVLLWFYGVFLCLCSPCSLECLGIHITSELMKAFMSITLLVSWSIFKVHGGMLCVLQGFHLLMDWCDGFGGYGAGLLQYLEDEFTNKARMTCAVSPAIMPDSVSLPINIMQLLVWNLCLPCASCLEGFFWKLTGPHQRTRNGRGPWDVHNSGIEDLFTSYC